MSVDPALHASVLAAVPFKSDVHLAEDLRFFQGVGPVSPEVADLLDALTAEAARRWLVLWTFEA